MACKPSAGALTHAHRVCGAQAGWASRYMGKLVMEFGADGKVSSITGAPVLLGGPNSDHPVAEDARTKADVQAWKYW